MPRLPIFQDQYDDLKLHVSTSYAPVEFHREDFDLAIRYGQAPFGGLKSELLFEESLIPVCAPSVLDNLKNQLGKRYLEVTDLAHAVLLHSDTCTANWHSWLTLHADSNILLQARSAYFDSCMLSFQAANAGMGFAVANQAYVQNDIDAGRLVAPFQSKLHSGAGWYLVCPEHHLELERVLVFRDWITGQAAESASTAQ